METQFPFASRLGCLIVDDTLSPGDYSRMLEGQGKFIIQPLVQGISTSLCCLFQSGTGWPICANLLQMHMENSQYRLAEIVVNQFKVEPYRHLVDRLAKAFPGLWGYVGIDLIETKSGIRVLEINPRLTTSLVGIKDAIGLNIVQEVISLWKGKSLGCKTVNRAVTVNLLWNNHEIE